MTEEQDKRIEMTKEMAVEEIYKWRAYREETISVMKDTEKPETTRIVNELFLIADQLTDVVLNCIDIKHQLTPQIVGVVSSMVLGITKGTGIKEVETLLRVKDNVFESISSMH